MPRARLLKPDFFRDEELCELPFEVRLLFAGLWTLADREGRLEYRLKRIKADLFPYDDGVDVAAGLERLNGNFITIYESDGDKFIQINTFSKHQHPHIKEPKSTIPGKPRASTVQNSGMHNASTKSDTGEHAAKPSESLTGVLNRSPLTESLTGEGSKPDSSGTQPEPAASAPPPPSPAAPVAGVGNANSPRFSRADVESILVYYPLKSALGGALYQVEQALIEIASKPDGPRDPVAWLRGRVEAYAQSDEGKNKPRKAHWWFSDKCYNDDPSAWNRGGGGGKKSKVESVLGAPVHFNDTPMTDEEKRAIYGDEAVRGSKRKGVADGKS